MGTIERDNFERFGRYLAHHLPRLVPACTRANWPLGEEFDFLDTADVLRRMREIGRHVEYPFDRSSNSSGN